jgi:hypothetical protein
MEKIKGLLYVPNETILDMAAVKILLSEHFFLDLVRELSNTCKIWGFHGSEYEEWHHLGCYAVWLL